MKPTGMTRRSMLGGMLTAGAVAALPEGVAHASSNDAFGGQSLSAPRVTNTPLSAATPGLHYDRFSAVSFVPARPAASAYFSEPGSIRHNSADPEYFLC